ncbi:membrane protein [Polaribacter pacificus]|uniref:Membrane protein n=1 Tax=Polaribacter pacificus TaxID=1775173 RepID=A0A917HXB5_9FLAO|nr:DMT family transporter [Polaribacter pacificus]GGG93798.1 membrane protein [Polaribacter pacificus]
MEKSHGKHISEVLIATLFISTSGVLGKYIAIPPPVLVWWRAFIALFFLWMYCRIKKIDLRIQSKKDYLPFVLSAACMAAHWISYFYALKLSNVALGMLSLYTFPVITALLEPFFMKTKLNPIHLVLGAVVLIGVYILAPDFSLENNHLKGILIGILSALFYAVRILILKQHVAKYHGSMLMFYQLCIVAVLLTPFLFFMDVSGIQTQYPYVLLLALLTTAIGHTLMVLSLRYFSVSTASILSSIQPVFGIFLAFLFLNEVPTLNTFFGGFLILTTVVIESVRSKKK